MHQQARTACRRRRSCRPVAGSAAWNSRHTSSDRGRTAPGAMARVTPMAGSQRLESGSGRRDAHARGASHLRAHGSHARPAAAAADPRLSDRELRLASRSGRVSRRDTRCTRSTCSASACRTSRAPPTTPIALQADLCLALLDASGVDVGARACARLRRHRRAGTARARARGHAATAEHVLPERRAVSRDAPRAADPEAAGEAGARPAARARHELRKFEQHDALDRRTTAAVARGTAGPVGAASSATAAGRRSRG